VRSRDTDGAKRLDRDLIEAGLNWPACQRRYGCCAACPVARWGDQGTGVALWRGSPCPIGLWRVGDGLWM